MYAFLKWEQEIVNILLNLLHFKFGDQENIEINQTKGTGDKERTINMEKVKHDILKEMKGASLFKSVIYDTYQIDSELNDKENKENEIEIIDLDENPFDFFDYYYNNIRNTINKNFKNSRRDEVKMHAQDNAVRNKLENMK